MAIKIYQSQVRPTTEVSERASTSGMKIDQNTMTMIPRAFKGMMQAGEDVYIKYEKQKAENQVIEASKEIDKDEFTEHPAGGTITTSEGLATRVNKYKESTKPDEAMAAYKADWEKTLKKYDNKFTGPFAKKLFTNYMNKRFISESGTIRDNTFINFRNESKTLKIKELDGISYRIANSQVGSREYEMAVADKNAFFTNSSNADLFGDKFKQLEFDTANNIDVLTITNHLSKDPIGTLDNFNNNVYKGLNAETKIKIGNKIVLAAQAKMTENITSDTERAKLGLDAEFDTQSYLKAFEGYENYNKIKTAVDANNFVRSKIKDVHSVKQSDLGNIQLYDLTGSGDEIAAKRKANNIISGAIKERSDAIKNNNIVGYLSKVDMEVKTIDDAIRNAGTIEEKKSLAEEKKVLLDKKFDDLGISESKRFYVSQAEIQAAVAQITDPGKTMLEKKGAILSYGEIYGKEHMPQILKQMEAEGMPNHYFIAMSTNSQTLNDDILQSYSTKDLEKVVKAELPSGTTTTDIKKRISSKINDFEEVIENQLPGSFDVINYKKNIEETLYRAVLYRVDKGMDYKDAVDKTAKEFLRDYAISPDKNFFIPRDVNGVVVNTAAVLTKTEAIGLEIEQGDMLDKFMGKDGYKHYASNLDISQLTEEDINTRVKSAIQKNHKFLLNDTSTGLILYYETADGPIPVVNSQGLKVEFLFTDQLNNKTGLDSTEYVFPHTQDKLTIIEEYDVFGTDEGDGGLAG